MIPGTRTRTRDAVLRDDVHESPVDRQLRRAWRWWTVSILIAVFAALAIRAGNQGTAMSEPGPAAAHGYRSGK